MWECVCERKGELKDLSAEVLTTTGKIILWLNLKPKIFAFLWAETPDRQFSNKYNRRVKVCSWRRKVKMHVWLHKTSVLMRVRMDLVLSVIFSLYSTIIVYFSIFFWPTTSQNYTHQLLGLNLLNTKSNCLCEVPLIQTHPFIFLMESIDIKGKLCVELYWTKNIW